MRVNYHYYTVKTLAHIAGFDDDTAQFIAYFSQYIDEFIMHEPFVVEGKPPEFFIQNGLARELYNHFWIFLPCPTGVNMTRTTSRNYQMHTLMPFHFIMPSVLTELPEASDRSKYRCRAANESDDLLIHRLMKKVTGAVNVRDKSSLMALGMLLHTFADTYSHCGFSGFRGWENRAYVSSLIYKSPHIQDSFFLNRMRERIKKYLIGRRKHSNSMNLFLHLFYGRLPSIGHAKVGLVPDCCECEIAIYAKETREGERKPLIDRDNSDFFGDCSRRILNILCDVNGRPPPGNDEWKGIRERLAHAQTIRDQGKHRINRRKWSKVFPEVLYHYNKREFIDIKLAPLNRHNGISLGLKKELELEFKKRGLSDIYSGKGDQARAAFPMVAKDVSEWFYTFNELAYRHVFRVTGEHASAGDFEQMETCHEHASKICI